MQSRQWMYTWAALAVVAVGLFLWRGFMAEDTDLPYRAANPREATVSELAAGLGSVTRIKFSPDGNFMLVGVLTGEVYGLVRQGDNWIKQTEPVLAIETAFPGFPPEENGLTGIAFAADYADSHEVFFTYSFREAEADFRNRVARARVELESDTLVGADLTDIYELATPTGSSHQIQGVIGVMIADVSHALFLVGEGFKAERALRLQDEAGKLMLVDRTGGDPRGPRPFPAAPKIQALGIRNAPDLALNPADPLGRLAIVDTGPDQFDRFIYGRFIDPAGAAVASIDLGWDGTAESLTEQRTDPNVTGSPDTILYRWDPTHTATNIVFHPGKGAVPPSTATQASVFVSLFGRTGETGKGKPGREIWLGTLTYDAEQPNVSWQPFVVRSKKGISEVGHPIGLERDPVTDDLVFGDIITGKLYLIEIKEN